MKLPKLIFNIETSGVCNLHCPSCPQGQEKDKPALGWLSCETLFDILNKAREECEVVNVELFNWTEPLLHPEINELIKTVNYFGFKCDLSTNLNKTVDFVELLEAKPFRIRISLSGFTQATYSLTHSGGDIERVKTNMKKLAAAKLKLKSPTLITVFYHIYKHNVQELPLMRAYAQALGFQFAWCWAAIMPVEKVIDTVEHRSAVNDLTLVENLHYDLQNLLYEHQTTTSRCTLLEDKISLDHLGNVKQCCAVYKAQNRISYLTTPLAEIQSIRRLAPICGKCVRYGIKDYNVGAVPGQNIQALIAARPEDRPLLNSLLHSNAIRTWTANLSRKLFTVEQSAKLGAVYDKTLGKLIT